MFGSCDPKGFGGCGKEGEGEEPICVQRRCVRWAWEVEGSEGGWDALTGGTGAKAPLGWGWPVPKGI